MIVQLLLQEHKGHSERIVELYIVPRFALFALFSLNLGHLTQSRIDPGQSRTVRSINNIEYVLQDVNHNLQKSVRKRSEELRISKNIFAAHIEGRFKVLSVQNSACAEDGSKRLGEKPSIRAVII